MSKHKYQSIELIKTPLVFKTLFIVSILITTLIFLTLFLPWRQTVTGVGAVTVFSPMERPQTIQSQIPAQVKKWHVQEGDYVQKGDTIVELQELDTKYLDDTQIDKLKGQRDAIKSKVQAITNLIATYKAQLGSLGEIRRNVVPNAELKIEQNENKLLGMQQKINGLEQNQLTAKLNLDRRKKLYEKGLVSKRDLELAELAFAKAEAELNSIRADYDIAEQQIAISKFGLTKVGLDNQLKGQEIQSKIASSYDKLAEANKELYKLENEVSNLEQRIFQRTIKAIVAGQVTGVKTTGAAQTIKKDEVIATIIPDTEDIAVELFVSEFFAPLLSVGRDVRIQFSGYPAIQFAGWPSIAVGTFAGKIAAVDAVNLRQGEFRILVKPDLKRIKEKNDVQWPSLKNLRPGSKAWGWIILDEVPIWYELWRIMNGFPPSIMENKNKVTEVPKIK